MVPRHPRRDPGEHFVGNRSDALCEIPGRDRIAPVVPDEDNLVPYVDIGINTQVDHELIHADDAGHGISFPAYQDLRPVAEPAVVAVTVSDRDRGDPGLLAREIGPSILTPGIGGGSEEGRGGEEGGCWGGPDD